MSTTFEPQATVDRPEVVYIDLDGTFLRTDTLWESVLQLTRRKPWLICALLFRLLSGKARLKSWLASHVELSWDRRKMRLRLGLGKWAILDSNQRPPPCEGGALTN